MADRRAPVRPQPLRKVAEQFGDVEVVPILDSSGQPLAWVPASAGDGPTLAAAAAASAPGLVAALRQLLAALPESGYADEDAWKAALAARRHAEQLLARFESEE